MVLEADVGIVAYANDAQGFAATLKHRYSDFRVNEIRQEGGVVRLVNTTVPKAAEAREVPLCSAQELIQKLESATGNPASPDILDFLERVKNGSVPPSERIHLGPFQDKAQRTAVHGIFKAWPTLATETGAEGSIELGLGGGKGIKRRRSEWAGGDARYVKFTMYKENMESQAALSLLGSKLHVSAKVFGIAGTKDKRGCTCQEVTAFRVDPGRLATAAKQLRGISVGDFSFTDEELHLGQLGGNRFELILRGLPPDAEEDVKAACTALAASGFINYFGLQRFGSGPIPTHAIGRALLAGQWDRAVASILGRAGPDVLPTSLQEVKSALRGTPGFAVAETAVLQALLKHGATNYLTAVQAIPRNLRTMYIHAYQSYLWNSVASFRLRQSRSALLVGDLVAQSKTGAGGPDGSQEFVGSTDQVPLHSENEVEFTEPGANAKEAAAPANMAVHIISAEDLDTRSYSMSDLLLPLPGSSVRLPENATGEEYARLLAEDGLSLETSAHGTAGFTLAGQTGAYRLVLSSPGDVEWELLRHSAQDTDLAEGQGVEPGGALLALRLAFSLAPSSYATMVVRELTKQSGAALHAALPRAGPPV
ncbi:hypothetical protein ACKKBF_B15330 [Auxenochlorella protothecoides x Auxenochlorella symbiontica]